MWFRGKGTVQHAEELSYHPDVIVHFNDKAWANKETIISSYNKQMVPWVEEHIPGEEHTIFLDNLGCQTKKEYLDLIAEHGGSAAFGPANLTHAWAPSTGATSEQL